MNPHDRPDRCATTPGHDTRPFRPLRRARCPTATVVLLVLGVIGPTVALGQPAHDPPPPGEPGTPAAVPAAVGQRAPSCESQPEYQKIDFWVGEWRVVNQEGTQVGENVIEKILDGCAIVENWTGRGGGRGKSLFYYDPGDRVWKQVWVTDTATSGGGTKEKRMIAEYEDGGVRFQGTVTLPNGARILDRTTLTPVDDGRVRQVIEWSRDGGETWNLSFDAFYVPREEG